MISSLSSPRRRDPSCPKRDWCYGSPPSRGRQSRDVDDYGLLPPPASPSAGPLSGCDDGNGDGRGAIARKPDRRAHRTGSDGAVCLLGLLWFGFFWRRLLGVFAAGRFAADFLALTRLAASSSPVCDLLPLLLAARRRNLALRLRRVAFRLPLLLRHGSLPLRRQGA